METETTQLNAEAGSAATILDPATIAYTDPVYKNETGTRIDVNLEHPALGWIPFTADANDIEQFGRDLHARIVADAAAGIVVIAPYVAPPPQPYVLGVDTIWGRMTDQEAIDFDSAMAVAQPLRLRRQFQSATSMTSDSELFTFTRGVMLTVFSEVRTDEILAQ